MSGTDGAERQEDEARKVDDRAAIGAHIVLAAIQKEGEEELQRPPSALAWSGLAAGLSMGFSLLAEALLRAHLADAIWRPLLTKTGYCVGFLIVVLGRQQLFTENTLTVILPLLDRRSLATLVRVAKLWGVVLAANLAGTFLFAWFASSSGVFDDRMLTVLGDVAREAVPAGFWLTFLRAIFAGWLIALMVWLLPAAESARVSIVVILTYLIGLGNFAHVVAGSTKVMFAVLIGATSWPTYFGGFMLPSLAGNIAGGVAMVAALGHAQVKSGEGHAVR